MRTAIELIEYLAGVEAQNAMALQAFPTTTDEGKAMAEFFGQQAAKKTIAFAQLRKIVQGEMQAQLDVQNEAAPSPARA